MESKEKEHVVKGGARTLAHNPAQRKYQIVFFAVVLLILAAFVVYSIYS